MKARRIGLLAALILAVLVIAGGAYAFGQKSALHSASIAVSSSAIPSGYVGFVVDSIGSARDSNSIDLTPYAKLHLKLTLFTPNDPGDARLRIQDLETGTTCDTDNYLIEHVYVSSDEKTALIYHFSGSAQYLDTVDTATCKQVAPTQDLEIFQ